MSKIYKSFEETIMSFQAKELVLLLNISSKVNEAEDNRKISGLILLVEAKHTEMQHGTVVLLKKNLHEIIIEDRHCPSNGATIVMKYRRGQRIIKREHYYGYT